MRSDFVISDTIIDLFTHLLAYLLRCTCRSV